MKGAIEKTHQFNFFFENHQVQVLMIPTLIPSFQKNNFQQTWGWFQKFVENNFTQVSKCQCLDISYQLIF
jgi:hypothetical protein